ncbi:hypothetical protein BFL43_01030 [Williamsia sp. 1135]|nr:hypothetical protein BFL43_01030 [Williamsia sp. 1135]
MSGLIPVLLAALKVVVVSGGDPQALRALVQDLDVLGLVLATFLPIGSTLLLWGFVFWAVAANKAVGKVDRAVGHTPEQNAYYTRLPVVSVIVVAVCYWSMPVVFLVSNIGIVVALTLLGVLFGRRERLWARSIYIFGIVLIVASIIIYPLVSGMWLTAERISARNERPEVGYVLSSDVRWTRYMNEDRRVIIVSSSEVTRREPVKSSGWFHETPKTLIGWP